MALLHRLREEVSKVALATLYFFVAFSIVMTLKMLYLAEYAVEISAIAKATFGALVVGKVVVVLGATSFGTRFRRRTIALYIVYRAFLYTLAVFAVMVVERVVHGYIEARSWSGAWEHAMESANLMRLLGNTLGIYLAFVGYNILGVFALWLGRDRVLRFLFTRDGAVELERVETTARTPATGH